MLLTSNNSMSKITTTLVITSRPDEVLTAREFISAEQIRSVTLNNVLVDAGATICLPSQVKV